MSPPLRLRVLTRADLPFANSLRALAGWNQTVGDWERFLAIEPDGCFLAEWHGAPAGTATTLVYGPALAWIGMILVHPKYRRRGIGRALLTQCIDYLQGRGVRGIKLDATPLGKTVYDNLGFKEEWTLTRWQRQPGLAQESNDDPAIRLWGEADSAAVEVIDAGAFGISRRQLVQRLAVESRCALVLESESTGIDGYGLLRNGAQADYLGPVVARSSTISTRLAGALVERGRDRTLFWDIPDQNLTAVALARQHHFTTQRPLIRMVLGENTTPGDPQMQFAIAGPESG